MAITYAPQNWASCQGQLMAIRQNTALFSLLGTTYGGDGVNTFALPDLRGRTPVGMGQGQGLSSYSQGERTGTENVTLAANEMPAHTHAVTSTAPVNTDPGADTSPGNKFLANAADNQYSENPGPGTASMAADLVTGATGPTGSGQAHNNLMPYLTLSYCIALQGVFPPRP